MRYRYRLRPGAQAERALLDEWDRARWVWNQAVATLKQTGEWVTDRALTAWRKEHDWLAAGSVVAQQQVLRDFRAKRAKGAGRRKFKSRHKSPPSLNYTTRGFSLKESRIRLAGGVSVPVVWSRDLPAAPSSVRVYRDPLGHWYASFVVRRADEPAPAADAAIGVDWGVKTGRDHHRPRVRPAQHRSRQARRGGVGQAAAAHGSPTPRTRPRRVEGLPDGEAGRGQSAPEGGPATAGHRPQMGGAGR